MQTSNKTYISLDPDEKHMKNDYIINQNSQHYFSLILEESCSVGQVSETTTCTCCSCCNISGVI